MLETTNILGHDPQNFINEREKVMVSVQANVDEKSQQ